uniref:Palmitoyltransferase n=1 Tax=Ascaris suum TaxID=6253 RepID=F1L4J0_ASCSU
MSDDGLHQRKPETSGEKGDNTLSSEEIEKIYSEYEVVKWDCWYGHMSDDGLHQRKPETSGERGDNALSSEEIEKIYSEYEVVEAPDWESGIERGKDDFGKTMSRRLLHWGPIIAMAITLSIGISATYLHLQWWPLNSVGSFLHLSLFLLFNYLVFSNLAQSAFIGPGYVPLAWSPPSVEFTSHLQYCAVCEGYKVPRSHHCSTCGRCVMKMDHHCPWINNCVGHRNHAYFIRFLAAAVAGCIHGAMIISLALYRGLFRAWYIQYGSGEPEVILTVYTFIMSVFAFGLALGVIVAVGFLLIVQLKGVWKNRTGIEDYIVDKANSYERSNEFLYPYDLGWKRNVREVLGTWNGLPVGNGVWWPIRRPTSQFSLSEEQLMQKRIKRLNAREVQIIRKFDGTCLSALLIGFRVFICQPCSDERRISVEVGERWMVTRVNKYWFYATKKVEDPEQEEKLNHPLALRHHRALRGWFPRVCAERVP